MESKGPGVLDAPLSRAWRLFVEAACVAQTRSSCAGLTRVSAIF